MFMKELGTWLVVNDLVRVEWIREEIDKDIDPRFKIYYDFIFDTIEKILATYNLMV